MLLDNLRTAADSCCERHAQVSPLLSAVATRQAHPTSYLVRVSS